MSTRRPKLQVDVEIDLGRRRRLDRERVVQAALVRLDQAGPAEFTLRGVARDLGVYVNSVTHHAESREALMRAAVGLALADVMVPNDVRDVRRCALDLRAALLAHAGVAGAALEIGLLTTRAGALMAAIADILAAAPGGTDSSGALARAVAAAVFGAIVVECATDAPSGSTDREAAFSDIVDALITPFGDRH